MRKSINYCVFPHRIVKNVTIQVCEKLVILRVIAESTSSKTLSFPRKRSSLLVIRFACVDFKIHHVYIIALITDFATFSLPILQRFHSDVLIVFRGCLMIYCQYVKKTGRYTYGRSLLREPA
jgi:hypothetical protein